MTAAPWSKQHNSKAALAAKLELRHNVLSEITPAHVFDAFCGPDGAQWDGAWKQAASYVGCDLAFKLGDPRRRFVGDSRRIMRCIDLSPFNVFDLDAFGSPWEWLVILAARRAWAPGERGAVVITDGSYMTAQFGRTQRGGGELPGISIRMGLAPTGPAAEALQAIALQAWLFRSQVRALRTWQVRGTGSRQGLGGGLKMIYTAVVFEGLPIEQRIERM